MAIIFFKNFLYDYKHRIEDIRKGDYIMSVNSVPPSVTIYVNRMPIKVTPEKIAEAQEFIKTHSTTPRELSNKEIRKLSFNAYEDYEKLKKYNQILEHVSYNSEKDQMQVFGLKKGSNVISEGNVELTESDKAKVTVKSGNFTTDSKGVKVTAEGDNTTTFTGTHFKYKGSNGKNTVYATDCVDGSKINMKKGTENTVLATNSTLTGLKGGKGKNLFMLDKSNTTGMTMKHGESYLISKNSDVRGKARALFNPSVSKTIVLGDANLNVKYDEDFIARSTDDVDLTTVNLDNVGTLIIDDEKTGNKTTRNINLTTNEVTVNPPVPAEGQALKHFQQQKIDRPFKADIKEYFDALKTTMNQEVEDLKKPEEITKAVSYFFEKPVRELQVGRNLTKLGKTQKELTTEQAHLDDVNKQLENIDKKEQVFKSKHPDKIYNRNDAELQKAKIEATKDVKELTSKTLELQGKANYAQGKIEAKDADLSRLKYDVQEKFYYNEAGQ